MKRKQIVIDYLISLGICVLIFACFLLAEMVHKVHEDETISHFLDNSKSKEESKKSGKYLGRYVYDSLHSENKIKDSIDSELWFEKVAYFYYKEGEGNKTIKVADSVFKDTVLCIPEHFTKTLDMRYGLTWKDKRNETILREGSAWDINLLKYYPDTLLLIAEKNEFVYKGKICIVKE